MKSNYPTQPNAVGSNSNSPVTPRFSRRLARPSVGLTVSTLLKNNRIDDLWDASLLDRLQSPLTRNRY